MNLTLTTDGWTSSAIENIMSVTVHFVSKECELKSALLSCFMYNERHTSVNMSEKIVDVLTEWKVKEKVMFAVTDNAPNIVNSVKISNWLHIPCTAHTLNLVVQHGLQTISNIRKKVKATVDYFHRSPQANSKLLATQTRINPNCTPLKLNNDVPTRWNSTFYMFERLINLEESVTVTVGLLQNPVQLLSEEEWSILKDISNVLRPFEQITNEMSSEKSVSASKVIIIVRGLICSKNI